MSTTKTTTAECSATITERIEEARRAAAGDKAAVENYRRLRSQAFLAARNDEADKWSARQDEAEKSWGANLKRLRELEAQADLSHSMVYGR